MSFDSLIFWPAIISCAILLARSVPAARHGRSVGWAAVSGAILLLGGTGLYYFPAQVEWVVGILWAVFVLAPSLTIRAVVQSGMRQRFREAARWATVVRWLHPADGWPSVPALYHALALSKAGRRGEAVARLEALANSAGTSATVAQTARLNGFRIQGNWEDLLAWTEKAEGPQRASLHTEPGSMLLRGRALGETGRLSEMIGAYCESSVGRNAAAAPNHWSMWQLYLFAFGGREAATARLLAGPLADLSEEAKAFWRATARMAAGQPEAARGELRALAERTEDDDLRQAVERRLSRELAEAGQVLSPPEQEWLGRLEAQSASDLAYHPQVTAGLRGAYATLGLIALNCGMFLVEMASGGSENGETLYRLGALWPSAIYHDGEWYRLLAAMFLHFGWLHLGMNLFALALVGPWVEQVLGRIGYLVVYFVTGIGSMLAVLVFMRLGWMREEFLVGASGAIMGIIGATGALLAIGRRRGSGVAAKRLRGIALIVAFQTVFDLLTPKVSFAAHAAGVVLGFLVTFLFAHRQRTEISS